MAGRESEESWSFGARYKNVRERSLSSFEIFFASPVIKSLTS